MTFSALRPVYSTLSIQPFTASIHIAPLNMRAIRRPRNLSRLLGASAPHVRPLSSASASAPVVKPLTSVLIANRGEIALYATFGSV